MMFPSVLVVLGLFGQLVTFSAAVNTWQTTCDGSGEAKDLLTWKGSFAHSNESSKITSKDNYVELNIDLSNKLQTMTGFGAGLPQSSASVLKSLKDRNQDVYWQVLTKIFSEDNYGANMNILRFPIGSCDFSMVSTSYDEVANDYNLDNFKIDNDSWMIVEVLQDILKVNPRMVLIGK